MLTIRKIFLKSIAALSIFGCTVVAGKVILTDPIAIRINTVIQSVKHEGDSSVMITNKDYAELINIQNINILKDPIYTERGKVKNSTDGFVDDTVAQGVAYEDHLYYTNDNHGIRFNPKNPSIGMKFRVDSLLKSYGYDKVSVGNFRLDKEVTEKNLSFEYYTPKVKSSNSVDSLILKYDLNLAKITFFTFSSVLDARKKGKLSGVYYVLNKTAARPRIQISSEIEYSILANPLVIQKLISKFKEQN